MEDKCMKTSVFTLETVFKDAAEVPIDIDFNLPDYCPEVSRILKCRAVPRIAAKSANGRSVTVDGGVTITLIYSDEDNMINSYEYQYPFSKTFDSGVDLDSAVLDANVKCEYINCRAVTERKIDIHGAISVNITARRRKNREIISDIDDENIELMRAAAPATMPIGQSEKYVIVEEELEIGSSQPDIRCLVRYDADVSISECKLLAGKAIVKGEMAVSLLYRSDDGELQTFRSNIPFSQLLEIESAGDDCICEATANIAYLEIKPKVSSSSPTRTFSLDAKLCLRAGASCENDVEVITDAYSRKYEASILSDSVCFDKTVYNISDTFNIRKEIDFSSGSISAVYDIWVTANVDSVRFEGDCMMLNGTAVSNILAREESGMPVFYEKPIPFEYSFKIPIEGKNLKADPKVSVTDVNYTISGSDKMEIGLKMAVNAAVYECADMTIVSDIKINENEPLKQTRQGAMTVYFADPGESIWEIARKYLADISEIRRLNGISEDKLQNGQMILIPVS